MTGPSRADPPSRLARRLGVTDAVVIGLGSMIGAGVFAAIGPAAAAAGSGLLVGLVIAGVVATCNATSSARLAAEYPASGGTYVYGRERLGPFWGYLAGWGFVVGKTASCAAMALTVGAYVAPSWQRPIGVAMVVALTAVNYCGVTKTAAVTRVIVVAVLIALGLVIVAGLLGGEASLDRPGGLWTGGLRGVLESAGLLFFAFAGYARVATLGEEVRDPGRTIPRAVRISLAITFAIYGLVATTALVAVGPAALAGSPTPLATVARAGSLEELAVAVRIGGTLASAGVLLSMVAGVSRTLFAMAADRELPPVLAAVHPAFRVPHRAVLVVGTAAAGLVALTDVRHAIGFSSFCVLTYYAIANASAWTLPTPSRHTGRVVAALGLAGCVALAVTLPLRSAVIGAAVLATGAVGRLARRARFASR